MAVTRYFLGGNTASGFVSFYGQFCRGPEEFLWVIKGGPGCGKSSFMKTIGKAAEDAGLDTEYVLCSGDPEWRSSGCASHGSCGRETLLWQGSPTPRA